MEQVTRKIVRLGAQTEKLQPGTQYVPFGFPNGQKREQLPFLEHFPGDYISHHLPVRALLDGLDPLQRFAHLLCLAALQSLPISPIVLKFFYASQCTACHAPEPYSSLASPAYCKPPESSLSPATVPRCLQWQIWNWSCSHSLRSRVLMLRFKGFWPSSDLHEGSVGSSEQQEIFCFIQQLRGELAQMLLLHPLRAWVARKSWTSRPTKPFLHSHHQPPNFPLNS